MGTKHLNLEFEDGDETASSENLLAKKKAEEERKAKELAETIEFGVLSEAREETQKEKREERREETQKERREERQEERREDKREDTRAQQVPVSSPKLVTVPRELPEIQADLEGVSLLKIHGNNDGKRDDRMYSELELQALVRAAVAESKLEYITDMAIEVKLLSQRIGKILTLIYTKVPGLKKEVIQIQKYLADHSQKAIPSQKTVSKDQKKAA